MKTETIKAIFTNVLFITGVGLLIFGFIRGSLTVSRLLAFEKYPLFSYEESRCEMDYFVPAPMPIDAVEKPVPAPDQEMIKVQKERCQTALERDRKVRKTEDIVVSVTTLLAGVVLVYSFRRFIFK